MSLCLPEMKALVGLHICTGLSELSLLAYAKKYQNLVNWLKWTIVLNI